MPEPIEQTKKPVGFIYVYYIDMDNDTVFDKAFPSDEELKPNEREITVYRAHPGGLSRVVHCVYDIEDLDRRYAELMIELLV